jgi:uncharacterized membrane protein
MNEVHRTRDDGTIMILTVFFALIVAALVTVVVDVSTIFLAKRELQSVADSAVAAAAQQADLPTVYGAPVGSDLPLSAPDVDTFVNNYVASAVHRPPECAQAPQAVTDVTAGETVTIGLSCTVPLPFTRLVTHLWSDGVTIHVVAHARSVVTAAG